MLTSLEGEYRNGRIELSEVPPNIGETKVIVTFLPAEQSEARRGIWFGMFKGEKETTLEDFKIAEWRGERDDADQR